MDFSKEIKYFSAVTYNDTFYNFAVTPYGNIYCYEFSNIIPENKSELINIIELKPNFILRDKQGKTIYSLDDYYRDTNTKKSLIKEWIIDDDLFAYLLNNRKITYSTQMAILYGFDEQYAFDAYFQKRAFKYTRNNPSKRAKILARQKSGKFN